MEMEILHLFKFQDLKRDNGPVVSQMFNEIPSPSNVWVHEIASYSDQQSHIGLYSRLHLHRNIPLWMNTSLGITILNKMNTGLGVKTLSRLPDLFSLLLSCSHILCIQFSFNVPYIQYNYRTMSCMTGCFYTTAHT